MDTLNIIHLSRRQDRYDLLMPQLALQGITDYVLHEGIEKKHNRKEGICKSHKAIVREAKEKGLPMVHIAEDDIVFTSPGAWDYYLSKIPDSFDLFMGMTYVGSHDENGRINSICSGLTLYTVSERFYDSFLSIPDSCHVDRTITAMHKEYEFILIDKFVAYQSGSKSDNTQTTCDYTPLLQGRKLYGE